VELSTTAIFSVFADYFIGNFGYKVNIIIYHHGLESVVSFPLIPTYMTLNDLEWPFYVKFCFYASTLSFVVCGFEDNCVQTNKDSHTVCNANDQQGV